MGRYVLGPLPEGVLAVTYADDAEPLVPSDFSLSEYRDVQARALSGARTISRIVDETKRERASDSHRILTNLVAARIRVAGAMPRCNQFVDLAGRIGKTPFLFEIKSTTEDNVRGQIRRGISQLYEYRYLQRASDAQLVLVIEKPLGQELAWMVEYLVRDRGILLVWDGDMRTLHCPSWLKRQLSFLVA